MRLIRYLLLYRMQKQESSVVRVKVSEPFYKQIPRVSRDEMKLCIQQLVRSDAEPDDAASCSLLTEHDDPDSLPYLENSKILAFEHQMYRGHPYRRVDSAWGTFVIIPPKDMAEFDKYSAPATILKKSPALMYYLQSVLRIKSVVVEDISNRLCSVSPNSIYILDAYRAWVQEQKDICD